MKDYGPMVAKTVAVAVCLWLFARQILRIVAAFTIVLMLSPWLLWKTLRQDERAG